MELTEKYKAVFKRLTFGISKITIEFLEYLITDIEKIEEEWIKENGEKMHCAEADVLLDDYLRKNEPYEEESLKLIAERWNLSLFAERAIELDSYNVHEIISLLKSEDIMVEIDYKKKGIIDFFKEIGIENIKF